MKVKTKRSLMLLGGAAFAGTATAALDAHADTVTVQKGDTTWQLAKDHQTSVDQIVKDNNLSNNGRLIYVGQTLQINGVSDANAQAATITATDTTQQTTTTTQSTTQAAPQTQQQNTTSYTSNVSGNEAAAKEWIAARESGGSYTAVNSSSGAYGRYQLLPGYLNGDYSPANQERVADNYVAGRYGSWTAAQAFWQAHGWY